MIDVRRLKEEQLKLAKKVSLKDEFSEIKTIGGVDQAFANGKIISMVVVLDYNTFELMDNKFAIVGETMPYVPGFLGYREGPAIVEAFSKLERKPDLLMVDGNGILHQRRIGLASHVGLLLDVPTIGVAKKLLLGEVRGNKVFVDEKQLATLFVTKEHAKPIYVSPGHKISMKTTEEVMAHCLRGCKLPEPLRLAHKFANKIENRIKEEKAESPPRDSS